MNQFYSKAAGEEDALERFGLRHSTPRPPSTWAQEWLKSPRMTGTKSLTIPSMQEKKALLDPISLSAMGGIGLKVLAGGAASHAIGNGAQKLLRRFAPGLPSRQMASGLTHGLENKQMHPVMERLLSRGFGAESLEHYHAGQALAKQTAGMSPVQREAFLRTSGSAIKETAHLSKAPIVGAIPDAADHVSSGKPGFWHKLLPTAPTGTTMSDVPAWQRAIPVAAGGALSVADPSFAGHFGINAIRERVAKSDFGRKWVAKQIASGARGEALPGWKKHLMEYGLSPASTDPHAIGAAVNREYGDATTGANKWLTDRGHNAVAFPTAKSVAELGEAVYDRAQAKAAPAATAAPKPHQGPNGAMTAALVGGAGLYALNRSQGDDEDDSYRRRR